MMLNDAYSLVKLVIALDKEHHFGELYWIEVSVLFDAQSCKPLLAVFLDKVDEFRLPDSAGGQSG